MDRFKILDLDTIEVSSSTNEIIYVDNYPGSTDIEILSNAISNLNPGYKLYFTPNKTYNISSGINIKTNDVEILGNNATINYTGINAEYIVTIGNDVPKVSLNTINIQINKGDNFLIMSDISNIIINDFIMILDGKNNSYNNGLYATITQIDYVNKKIFLSNPSNTSFIATRLNVYSNTTNITLGNLNILGTSKNIYINVANCSNAKIKSNTLIGKGSRVGISILGINCIVEDNFIKNFFDDNCIDNKSGYGINLMGHYNKAIKNVIKDCKHCISSGDRRFYSTNLIYDSNNVYLPTDDALCTKALHALDNHGNAEAEMIQNNIFNIAKSGASLAVGIRNRNSKFKQNKLYSIYSCFPNNGGTLKGISVYEQANENIVISQNEFIGWFSNIIDINSPSLYPTNFTIEQNKCDFGLIQINSSCVSANKIRIQNNKILSDGGIWLDIDLTESYISDNYIQGGNNEYSNCITIGDSYSTNFSALNNKILNNYVIHGSEGGDAIRFYGDKNVIENNIIKLYNNSTCINNYNNSTNNIISNNTC